ncbi:hypothetical protein RCO28_39030 [Streptomyces sp. LHD-70]|uniref:DUF6653 family protein n=1 Tax=Streptomyces sp. LHD-70 TaxID=3072140 RepID=UPI00280FCA07|nr:DUF6653 family protein [Streptomyces sp. LHD-70]MDQ8708408.1 hypothetical protein [Streptomyces sp. LHD-70]
MRGHLATTAAQPRIPRTLNARATRLRDRLEVSYGRAYTELVLRAASLTTSTSPAPGCDGPGRFLATQEATKLSRAGLYYVDADMCAVAVRRGMRPKKAPVTRERMLRGPGEEQLMARIKAAADSHGMSDESWRQHANPWSVWTRFAAIPAFELAVWSRVWLGWWCLVGVVAVVVWLWLNVRLFGPVGPTSWAARGIYGEQLHVDGQVPAGHRAILNWLIATGLFGFGLIGWGLVDLDVWPLALGTVMVVLAQLWRIDRYGLLFQYLRGRTPDGQSPDTT